jgi:hypothetical protein
MADDLTKHLKSYTKDQLIARYNMKETYTNSQLKKIPKIELMEEIYGGVVNKTGKTYRKGGFVKRPSKKKDDTFYEEEYYEKYSDQGIENELDTPSEMLKEIRNKESKQRKNKVISKMPIYEIVPPPRKKEISASINLKKGGAVGKKSIMLKGRGGSFKGVK